MFLEINKTDEQISADILAELPAKYQKSVGFQAWDYARAISIGGLSKIYSSLKYICAMGDINNFEYDDLVLFVSQRSKVRPHVATYAKGTLTAKGNGTINIGDLFQTESGLQFRATERKTILEIGTFAVECVTAGAVGNVPENAIGVIPVGIAGIVSVTNLSATSGGYDRETKESIIERYLEYLQQPITSNNKNHYKMWAKEVAGVGDAKIKPLWNGDNTVKVVVINSDDDPANNTLVNAVQKYIDPFGYKVSNGALVGYVQNYIEDASVPTGETIYSNFDLSNVIATAQKNEFSYISDKKFGWGHGNGEADIGAYVTIESASAKNINVKSAIILKAGAVLAVVIENIKDEIRKYLKSTVFKDSYISYAQIGACILRADGVLDYDKSSFKVNNAEDNIILIDSDEKVEIAVLQTVTITEKEEQA